jgi:hypothetical protein
MKRKKHQVNLYNELTEEEKQRIRSIFHNQVVPKLIRLEARIGTINCEFAGEQFKNWTIQFRSVGSGFDIVEFEYDEDAAGIDLDL